VLEQRYEVVARKDGMTAEPVRRKEQRGSKKQMDEDDIA
jgi:hypothetical protein